MVLTVQLSAQQDQRKVWEYLSAEFPLLRRRKQTWCDLLCLQHYFLWYEVLEFLWLLNLMLFCHMRNAAAVCEVNSEVKIRHVAAEFAELGAQPEQNVNYYQ